MTDLAANASSNARAIARKLHHPILKIKQRALENLLFKLRAQLLVLNAQPIDRSDIQELMMSLLQCLDTNDDPIGRLALEALEIIIQQCDQGFCRKTVISTLQRQSVRRSKEGKCQKAFDKVLQVLLTTSPSAINLEQDVASMNVARHCEVVAPTPRPNIQTVKKTTDFDTHKLCAGWHFPPVHLVSADEQELFEFEVKLKLRTTTSDIVGIYQVFRHELLRSFPAEVFLQRPATLEYLLLLVQSPLIPHGSTNPVVPPPTHHWDRVLSVSYGMNYFDELGSDSFSSKHQHREASVFMTSLRAIESFVCAIQHSIKICTDPSYGVYESNAKSDVCGLVEEPTNKYYPQASSTKSQETRDQWSLSGAAFHIITSLLPLLRSDRHPLLHILNILHSTLPLLRERMDSSDGLNPLDKLRIESILQLLSDVCDQAFKKQVRGECTWPATVIASLSEFIGRLLRTNSPDSYTIQWENAAKIPEDRIHVPLNVWEFVRRVVTMTSGEGMERSDVAYLSQIDSTLPAYIAEQQRQRQDLKSVASFVTMVKSTSAVMTTNEQQMDIQTCYKVAKLLHLIEDDDKDAVVDQIVHSMEASIQNGVDDVDLVRGLIAVFLASCTSPTSSKIRASCRFFGHIVDLLERIDPVTKTEVLKVAFCCPSSFLKLLLLVVSTKEEEESKIFSRLLAAATDVLLNHSIESPSVLIPAIPLLQHLAYGPVPHQLIGKLLRKIEKDLDDATRLITMSRCLLHNSAYIRKAAVSGLLQYLGQNNPMILQVIETMDAHKRNQLIADPFCFSSTPSVAMRSYIVEAAEKPDGVAFIVAVSRRLTQFAKLRKLLSNQSPTSTVATTAFKELVSVLDDWPLSDFGVLEESGECEQLLDLVQRNLTFMEIGTDRVIETLRLLLIVLIKSHAARVRCRSDAALLHVVLSWGFHEDEAIRARLYHFVLVLTCDWNENLHKVTIPTIYRSSFGLFNDIWERCSFHVVSMQVENAESTSTHFSPVIVFEGSLQHDGDIVLAKWRDAASQAAFLNATYVLFHLSASNPQARQVVAREWEQDCERFLRQPASSARDQVVVGALMMLLSLVYDAMDQQQRVRLVLVIKRVFLPSFCHASALYQMELGRLLLRMQKDDLFGPLALDVKLSNAICIDNALSYTTSSFVSAIVLEIMCRWLYGAANESKSPVAHELLQKQAQSLAEPLLALVCEHHAPQSFSQTDEYYMACQVLYTIQRLNASDITLLTSENWFSRLIFDKMSPLRAMGFQLIAQSLPTMEADGRERLVRMAVQASNDPTECDLVRAQASDVVLIALQQQHLSSTTDRFNERLGLESAAHLFSQWISIFKNERHLVGYSAALCRMIRFLASDQLEWSDMKTTLTSATARDSYHILVQQLSLRHYQEIITQETHHRGLGDVWTSSFLPASLQLMNELLLLIHRICVLSPASIEVFATHTTIKYELANLVIELAESLRAIHQTDAPLRQRHYELLVTISVVMSPLLLHHPPHSSPSSARYIPAHLASAVAELVTDSHPMDFRVSFAQLIVAMLLSEWKEALFANDVEALKIICLSLLAALRDLAESSPMASKQTTALKRMIATLQVVIQSGPVVQQEVIDQKGVAACLQLIRDRFYAIRAAGGFGAKTKASKHAHITALCSEIEALFSLMATLLHQHASCQQLAMDHGLLEMLVSSWTILKMAHSHGNRVLLSAFRVIQNLIYKNDQAKASVASISTSDNRDRTLLALVFLEFYRYKASESTADSTLESRLLAGLVLKALLCNSECLMAAIKYGYLPKLLESLHRQLIQLKERRDVGAEAQAYLKRLIETLASAACLQEGRTAICSCTCIVEVMEDLLTCGNEAVQAAGSLLIRNLSFVGVSKVHVGMWDRSLDALLQCLYSSMNQVVLQHLSCTLWSLVYDHQKIRTLLRTKLQLDQLNQLDHPAIAHNLSRLKELVYEEARVN